MQHIKKKKKKTTTLLLLKSIHKEITTSIIIEKHMCKVNLILQGAFIPNDSNIWTSHGKFNDVYSALSNQYLL